MENEYTTKEMKPTETKVKKVKPSKDTPALAKANNGMIPNAT